VKIISNFKDYYDYAGFSGGGADDAGYKEKVYLRKPQLVMTEADIEVPYLRLYPSDRIFSRWWKENRQTLGLTDYAERLGAGCLFICGKAYPFLFLRGNSKSNQVMHSKNFNEMIADSYENEVIAEQIKRRESNIQREAKYNFFKLYYSFDAYKNDISIIEPQFWRRKWYRRLNQEDNKQLAQFFDHYKDRIFTNLHLKLNCPVVLTLFVSKRNRGLDKELREYEFLCNPCLQEFGFLRIMPAEQLYQEIEMYLGNILVSDIMPISPQSDVEKIASHGFDTRLSFRKSKSKE